MRNRNTCITVAGLALGGLLLAGSPAGAQSSYAPYIDQRQDNQQQRIQQGVDSGALTPGETNRLDRQQNHIQNAEDRMSADGNLSPRERDRLNRMENRGNRDIYRLKNNDRATAGHNGWSGHTNSAYGGNAYDPRFERRDAYQDRRIEQGIHSGALTPGEARYLNGEQARIDRAENRMSADGNLSSRERQRLNQMQNQANRDIYRLENNNRSAGDYHGNQAGWQGHDRAGDGRHHDWQANNRGGDRRDGWQGQNRGWDGRNSGWQGHNPAGNGNHPGGPGDNHGWQANGNSGWHGNNPVGNGYPSRGTAPNGITTAGYTPGQANGNSGWQGHNPGNPGQAPGGTTGPASNPQGWQGNPAHNGQPGGYQQAGAPGARPGQSWQGQPQSRRPAMGGQPQMRPSQPVPFQGRQQYQQPRAPMPQTAMRPNTTMMARQPMLGGMVNRASFSAPRGGSAPTMRRR
jgi:hypothetical protein